MLNKIFLGATFIITIIKGFSLADSPDVLKNFADVLREEEKTLEALDLYNQALVSYQKSHDYQGVLKVLCGRLISWQHLFNYEEDKIYAILAKKEAESMLAIAREYGVHDCDHLIHYLHGKTAIFLKDYKSAEISFRNAIHLFPNDNAEKGDWLAHLGEAMYRNGQKEEGQAMILKGIDQMEAHPDSCDDFQRNVWISGAYLRLAKILAIDYKLESAFYYFLKAEQIIANDSRLNVRRQQLEIYRRKIFGAN